jgi:hypothetical protein
MSLRFHPAVQNDINEVLDYKKTGGTNAASPRHGACKTPLR